MKNDFSPGLKFYIAISAVMTSFRWAQCCLRNGTIIAIIFSLFICSSTVFGADLDRVENHVFSTRVTIAFSGESAVVSIGDPSSITCSQDGAGVTLTSSASGVEYVLTGTSSCGFLKIKSIESCKVVLNGVNLSCTNGPALSILDTNSCYLVLAENTANVLSDSETYTQGGNGTLRSSGALILSGRGSLHVSGRMKHSIDCGTYLRMLGGDVTIDSAVKDGIHVAENFIMDQGTLSIKATGDAIDGDAGNVVINGGAIAVYSSSDDVAGIKCDGTLAVNGGALKMTVNGVQSKAVKSGGDMEINGGTLLLQLAGAVYLETVTNLTTNVTTVTTNYYVDPSYSAGIKCGGNLTVTDGQIIITHTGAAGKGISVDGNLVIKGGCFDIYTSGSSSTVFKNSSNAYDLAASDCIKADGYLQILAGTINAVSTGNAGDCISADGEAILGVVGTTNTPVLNLSTRGAKVLVSGSGMNVDYSNPKTFSVGGNLTVNGGTFTASTKNDGGEGMESKAQLTINGGNIEITAYDDCINAAKSLIINGGNIYCYSSGNDGIDSNGTMTINGGLIISSGTTAPEEGLDCDQNTFSINGGTIVGTGGASSTPTSASCKQRSVMYTASGTANTILQIKSASGNTLLYKVPRSYSGGSGGGPGGGMGGGMVLLFSNSSLAAGTSYTIVTGATVTGGTEFHGYYTGATVTGGTTTKTFTTSTTSMVTTVQ